MLNLTKTLMNGLQNNAARFSPMLRMSAAAPTLMYRNNTLKARNSSGLREQEFDYYFESKVDQGRYPHQYQSFMKILGEDYDTRSQQHSDNNEQMKMLNMELRENVE